MKYFLNIVFLCSNEAYWLYLGMAVLAGLAGLFFIYKKEGYKFFRSLFYLIGLGSLLLIAWQPGNFRPDTGKNILLLTSNFQEEKRDSLLEVLPDAEMLSFESVRTIQNLSNKFNSINKIHLLGDGLPESEWQFLENYPVDFYLNEKKSGTLSFDYSDPVLEKEIFYASGLYNNQGEKKKIILKTPEGKVDSVLLKKGLHSFKLKSRPKAAGQFEYNIIILDKNEKILNSNPFPVRVLTANSPHIFFLQNTPNFELKYIKNHLNNLGYRVTVKTGLTKGKTKTETFNHQQSVPSEFSVAYLNKIDLIITNGKTLSKMSNAQQQMLKKAIQAGLGLLLLPDAYLFSSDISGNNKKSFFNYDFKTNSKENILLQFSKTDSIKIKSWLFEPINSSGLIPVMKDAEGRILSAYRKSGKGRTGFHLFKKSYPLILSGKKTAYKKLWAEMLNPLLRRTETTRSWKIDPTSFAVNEPVLFYYFSKKTPEAGYYKNPQGDRIPFYWKEQPNQSGWWQGQFHPTETGTHIIYSTKEALRIQIPDTSAWKNLRTNRLLEKNKTFAQNFTPIKNNKILSSAPQPYPIWWFYLSFLFSAGLLWFFEKL